MKIKSKFTPVLLAAFLLLSFFSCSNDGNSDDGIRHVKVALVLPLSSPAKKAESERIASWFARNLEEALDDEKFVLDYEWYDEDNIDVKETAKNLAARNDIFSIVGLTKSSTTDTFAGICLPKRKPIISTTSTSEQILRKYSVTADSDVKEPFLWVLSECDISKIQAVLSIIITRNTAQSKTTIKKSKIALIAPGTMYGSTFTLWMPFQVSSASDRLELVGNFRYKTIETRPTDYDISEIPITEKEAAVQSLLDSGADYAFCAMEETEDVSYLLSKYAELKKEGKTLPKLYFGDSALSSEILTMPEAEGLSGLSLYADPSTGFQTACQARYGVLPATGEAQLYDALMLTALSVYWCIKHPVKGDYFFDNKSVQEALQNLTTNELTESDIPLWTSYGMKSIFSALKKGEKVFPRQIVGASGPLTFDKDTWTSIVCSVYMQWEIIGGNFVPIEFLSEKGSARVSQMTAAWKTQTVIKELTEEGDDSQYQYESHRDSLAVLIAASANKNNLTNYRHQADVLNVYQTLKKNNYTDDKIILIMADDIAEQTGGVIEVSESGPNLYQNVEIDYKISELTTADLQDILKGKVTQNLTTAYAASVKDDSRKGKNPPVLNGDNHTNVFIFWSGHGTNNKGDPSSGWFLWDGKQEQGKEKNFTTAMLYDTISSMYKAKSYRQLFLMVETCYALSVAQAITQTTDGHNGIPGVLALTASNAQEESMADVYNAKLRTYMTNRFTKNVLAFYEKLPDCTFAEVYENVAKNTTGSHVQIINASLFGILSKTSLNSFFQAP